MRRHNHAQGMGISFCAVAVLLVGFFACDIGSFPADTPLHPPLGLKLESPESGQIKVEFWSFNDEEAFAGYNIYVAPSQGDAESRSREFCLKNYRGAVPSRIETRSSEVIYRSYVISNSVAGPLPQNSEWYITVSAYDGYSDKDSRLGEIKSISVN